jgi:glucose/arabinose dehydrogenase
VWWISYRGEGKAGVENIGVFEDDGTPRKEHPLLLDPSPKAHPLHIARGFALVGDDLYIANAWRKDSHVARYRRHGDTFRFAEVVVTAKQISAMVHPFDVEFGDDGRLYVSCQDANTVLPILPKTRKPAPVASHLRKNFPNGNLVLHGDTLYIGAAGTGSILTYDIPKEVPRGKLKPRVVIDGKLKAPSGFAIGPDSDLYVAERFDQRVQRFSMKGKKRGTFIDGLPDMPEFLMHIPEHT